MPNVIVLSVAMLNVIVLSVVAPPIFYKLAKMKRSMFPMDNKAICYFYNRYKARDGIWCTARFAKFEIIYKEG